MSRIYTRPEWGARHRDGFGSRPLSVVDEIWLHHSVTASAGPQATFEADAATIRTLESIGQSRFGGGISYTFAVTEAGRAFHGHSVDRIGAHTAGHNTLGIAICLVGNYQTNTPTDPQIQAVTEILNAIRVNGWARRSTLTGGHRDVKSTSCPGIQAYNLIGAINTLAVHGSPVTISPPAGPAPIAVPTRIKVDGWWGGVTTGKAQTVLGTPVDKEVWYQHLDNKQPALVGGWVWNWTPGTHGSALIRRMMEVMKRAGQYRGRIDGVAGPEFFKGLQRRYGTVVDGELWAESPTVEAMQVALNEGRF